MTNTHGVDTMKILVKLTYLGLALGVATPAISVVAAYMLNGARENPTPEFVQAQIFFWGLLAFSFVGIGVAFFMRRLFFGKPFVRSEAMFVKDFEEGTWKNFIIIYAFINALPVYGLIYNFMGGEFRATMLFAILGVITFQFIRPRQDFIENALKKQETFVAEGKFGLPYGTKSR